MITETVPLRGPPVDKLTPNQQAELLTGRDYLSPSAISTFQRCPLKFYFSYILGLEPKFTSSALIFGSAIHAALEHHFRSVFEESRTPSAEELLAVFKQRWEAEESGEIRFSKGETPESLRDLAIRMLAAFCRSELSRMDSIVAIEEEFRAPIIPGCPDVLGRLDLVTLSDDRLRITDFKTARSSWNSSRVEEAADQQLLYAELIAPLAEAFDRPVSIEFVVITKTKVPSVERHTLVPDARQVARTKAVVQRVWQAISAGHFYPSPSPMNCSGCGFRSACRAWEG